jgi:hypothetical protein
MRSTPEDLVAVTTNTWRCPLILCRPGKGAWIPWVAARRSYSRIIDVAFIGNKLYAITKAEDLFALHIAEDDDGNPTISSVKQIIRHAPGHNDDMYNDGVWTGPTEIDALDDEDNEELDDEALDEQDNSEVSASSDEDSQEKLDDEALDEHDGRPQVMRRRRRRRRKNWMMTH